MLLEQLMFCIKYSLVYNEYLSLFIYCLFSVFLSLLIISASKILAKQNPDVEKLSAYECGFEPYEDAREKIEIKFCLIAILFLIFDIEIMFLIPWCVSISSLDLLSFWSMLEFLIELGVGFFYIWYVNSLNWN